MRLERCLSWCVFDPLPAGGVSKTCKYCGWLKEGEMTARCEGECTYSRAIDQTYPRTCVKCGNPELPISKPKDLEADIAADTATAAPLRIYDNSLDRYRNATQIDIDSLSDIAQSYGRIRTFLAQEHEGLQRVLRERRSRAGQPHDVNPA